VGETEGGGGHRVDRVGGGKGSEVVVLEELGLCLPLAVDDRVAIADMGKGQTGHLESPAIGGGGDDTTSSVPGQNLSNSVGLSLPLAVHNRGSVANSRRDKSSSNVREASNLESTMIGGGGYHASMGGSR